MALEDIDDKKLAYGFFGLILFLFFLSWLGPMIFRKRGEIVNNTKNKESFDLIKDKPVYLSLTSIKKNQVKLLKTLKTILKQTLKPDKIYLNLSEIGRAHV